jgi:hypothetical protein
MPTIDRALLSEIIDYAGLFPPAKLPMDEAFRRFVSHRNGDDGWLLARFVCPASRLAELAPLVAAAGESDGPVRLAVLGSGGDDPPALAEAMERDLEAMASFEREIVAAAPIDVYEVKLPREGNFGETVDFVCDRFEQRASHTPQVFFEVPLLGDWRQKVERATRALSAVHQLAPHRRVGLKIRCGGIEASAVPSVEAVAGAIVAARSEDVRLKATQGLHHPFRHHDPELGTAVHGFVNLLSAAVLAAEHGVDRATVIAIVAEEDPAAFSLTETALRWRELEADFEAVVHGRLHGVTGFGSCSFTEPRDDLASLGWL